MQKRLPAEWERQSGIMLTWPHHHTDWCPILAEVETVFVEISYHISRFEKLLIVCYDNDHQTHIQQLLAQSATNMQQVIFHICKSNDSWARDHGPISIINDHQLQIIDFQFNGWGNKYPADLDNNITQCLFKQNTFLTNKFERTDFVLEGGSIESDGMGTLLTTSACLLSTQRNPGLSRSEIETELKQKLGFNRLLWLEDGALEGDDTDSHIDTLVRFCDPETIMYQSCDDTNDAHFNSLKAMSEELKELTTIDNKPYKLVELPLPKAIYNQQGQRLPASYANFLIINDAVLVPVYDDQADSIVIEKFKTTFNNREIIPINACALLQQFGSIHCLTMQLAEGLI